VKDVDLGSTPLDRLAGLLLPERREHLDEVVRWGRELVDGRTVWHVNATASGGGVAEMLLALLAYTKGVGIDSRWVVLDGTSEFFALTKRIHNLLHGSEGDGGDLGDAEREVYDEVLRGETEQLVDRVKEGDVVVLHDPQTAGMARALRDAGVHVVWRCHIGKDEPCERTDKAWAFLRPYVEDAEAVVFSREAYVPDWVPQERVRIIPPSIDPFSAKNEDMDREDVDAVLKRAGLVEVHDGEAGSVAFARRDGSTGEVREYDDLVHGGQVLPADARLVLQVSRWDRLKDMDGVLRAFADHLDDLPDDVHLMLVGPDVSGVSDDPEGQQVLEDCTAIWEDQPDEAKARLHLCTLPMDDIDENAHIVNALQRHATVVVQKSIVEGFGLTVTEPMWKGRAVIATRVGGIQDQIDDGECGILLDDPHDLDHFARLLADLLSDEEKCRALGEAAKERVRERYLGDLALIRYAELIRDLIG
jgi:trehalose synthase